MNGLRIAVPVVLAVAAGALLTPAALRQAAPAQDRPLPPPPITQAPASSPAVSRDRAAPVLDGGTAAGAEAMVAMPEVPAREDHTPALAPVIASGSSPNPVDTNPPMEHSLSAVLGGLETAPDQGERRIKVGHQEQMTLLVSATQSTDWLVRHYQQTIDASPSAPTPEEADAAGRTNDALWLPAENAWLKVSLDCGDKARLRCSPKTGHPAIQPLKRGSAPNVWRWDIEALPHETSQRHSAQAITAVIMAGVTAEGPFQRIGQMPDQRLVVQIETASWIEQLLKRWTGVLTAISTFLAALLGVVLAIRRFRRKALEAAEADNAATGSTPEAPLAPGA